MLIRTLLTFVAIVGLTLAGCATTSQSHHQSAVEKPSGCTQCALGKAGETAWCDHCSVGYMKGKKTRCASCFEAFKANTLAACTSCAPQAKSSATSGSKETVAHSMESTKPLPPTKELQKERN